MKIRPSLAYIDPAPLKIIGKYIYNWPYFSLEMLRKRTPLPTQAPSKK